ncbi:MAG: methyltransferase domain-containing protein [Proteobacteria bacterium]|nr:methyltransferase domain-containing protein [Pseudomonadota bacterium]
MNARVAACELVTAVLDEGRSLDDALSDTPSFAALVGRDRAFARAMATATLRRLGGIDGVLARFLERPLPETAAHGRAMLRIGAAQLLLLQTPPHAAVGETVGAASMLRKSAGFAKLINAVLRRVAQDGAALLAAQPPGTDLPAWLFTRWRAAYGEASAAAIARALQDEAPLDVSVKHDGVGWARKLGGVLTPTGSVRISSARTEGTESWLPARGGIETLPSFAEGEWWVQDAAAALPARLLGDVRGKAVLDLCAAPGGKTLQLAAAGARVTAVDRSVERLQRLRENLARTRLEATALARDALGLRIREPFDAVLLDAPCTSTGTLRRHPDVAWLRLPSDIHALTELQNSLLAHAATMVKQGGMLVYAVCSMEPEEGPAIAARALTSGAWMRAPVTPGEIAGADEFITADGDLRTLPSQWSEIGGLDGFYAVRLMRLNVG